MPFDGLIPIKGGNSGAKRGGSSDLTGGLISLSSIRDNVDVDMSDFDVGDLLDDASKKTSSKNKNDDKKKKKLKEKEKSKKSKFNRKGSSFDDNDGLGGNDDGGWTSSVKNWDTVAELEMAAAAVARRKNNTGKSGGGLDDEFVKMLGLDSADMGGGAEFGSTDSPLLSLEPIMGFNSAYKLGSGDPFTMSDYTLTVGRSKMSDNVDNTNAIANDEATQGGRGGISASFFQDLNSTSLSSLLGPSTERRGGGRGGRRQGGGGELGPFGIGSTAKFDSLFGESSTRRSAFDDPFAKPARDDYDLKQLRTKDPIEEKKSEKTRVDSLTDRDTLPVSKRLSAKDDLLTGLFSSEPHSTFRDDRHQAESSKVDEVRDNDHEMKTMAPKVMLNISAVDPTKRQNDVLAELFTTSSTKTTAYDKSKEEEEKQDWNVNPAIVEVKSVTPPQKKISPPKKAESPVESTLRSGNANIDLASARDSLLMDLLEDISPPNPLLSRRRSQSNSNSPEKEVVKAEDSFKSILPPSSIQSQPISPVPLVVVETPPMLSTNKQTPDTSPSPGRKRTIAMDKGELTICESDFEQSNDSLLEEILPSSPSIAARSSPHRRNSYSQSFDVEESIVAEADEVHVSKLISSKAKSPQHRRSEIIYEQNAALAPVCNCEEREVKFITEFEVERAALQRKLDEFTHQLETQAAQFNKQIEERETLSGQLAQHLEARATANDQLTQRLAIAEQDNLQAYQLAATYKDDAASYQHRAELLEIELRGLREELSHSKRAVQDAELALARKTAEQDEVEQLERHREKRALEALSAQMQRTLARLAISHQMQEEGPGYDNSAARVAAEDEARLRVIASLEGSSKRAAQHAEQERVKLAELLRELEAGARHARQGALEDKERLRQEQQRLAALSAHLQAQTAVLRDQEASHAAFMGQQLAEAREDTRVYEARLSTRRIQLERDERALYEARAEFAAFREQTALEIERDHEQLRASRLALEDAWRELRADREDLEAELASHEDEFQALESIKQEIQEAEARLAKRTQEVVALAEKLDAGTRELLEREEIVAQQADAVQGTDTSFTNRERALERVKSELEAREQRLHVQIRQLDNARGRLTQQRREQQHLLAAAKRQFSAAQQPVKIAVDNNKIWRGNDFRTVPPRNTNGNNSDNLSSNDRKTQPWKMELHEEDPSGLPPALRKQVEANWKLPTQQSDQQRHSSGLLFDLGNFDPTSKCPSSWFLKTKDIESPTHIGKNCIIDSSTKVKMEQNSLMRHEKLDPSQAASQQRSTCKPLPAANFHMSNSSVQVLNLSSRSQPPPPPLTRSTGTFQPTLRVNL
ncbi:hypothetical protein PHMEG_00018199 [Phytophthora megakarya]|uniref:Uncharacterized protein n=1 Tax=Phytophthora megakarya TaxID=4795 RepID=A0A225VUC9_9STRA|nr:hypothetical protein PHMEG_00018199 [Phytophthora megakarya]